MVSISLPTKMKSVYLKKHTKTCNVISESTKVYWTWTSSWLPVSSLPLLLSSLLSTMAVTSTNYTPGQRNVFRCLLCSVAVPESSSLKSKCEMIISIIYNLIAKSKIASPIGRNCVETETKESRRQSWYWCLALEQLCLLFKAEYTSDSLDKNKNVWNMWDRKVQNYIAMKCKSKNHYSY